MSACLFPRSIINRRYAHMTPSQLSAYCKAYLPSDAYTVGRLPFESETLPTRRYSKELVSTLIPLDYVLHVPCGKCPACRANLRNGWSARLLQELDSHTKLGRHSLFLTLTFDEESLSAFKDDPYVPLRRFIDLLRKKCGTRPRYFFITELGGKTKRLHFHGILFGVSRSQLSFDFMHHAWKCGHSWIGYVNDRTCNYITKYLLKDCLDSIEDSTGNPFRPSIYCSNGLGLSYVNAESIEYHINGFDPIFYITRNGRRYPLHPYYRNKLFSDDVRLCFVINRASQPLLPVLFQGKLYHDYASYLSAFLAAVDRMKMVYDPLPRRSASALEAFVAADNRRQVLLAFDQDGSAETFYSDLDAVQLPFEFSAKNLPVEEYIQLT